MSSANFDYPVSSTSFGAACLLFVPAVIAGSPVAIAAIFALGPVSLTWVADSPQDEVSLHDRAGKWVEQVFLKALLGFLYAGILAMGGLFVFLMIVEVVPSAREESFRIFAMGSAQFVPLIVRWWRKRTKKSEVDNA